LEAKSKSEADLKKQEEFKTTMFQPKTIVPVFKMGTISTANILVGAKSKNKQISTVINKVTLIKNKITFKKKSQVQIKIKEFLKKNQFLINSNNKI
jgi:hypothetical protein